MAKFVVWILFSHRGSKVQMIRTTKIYRMCMVRLLSDMKGYITGLSYEFQ